jgi:hypothetical protein
MSQVILDKISRLAHDLNSALHLAAGNHLNVNIETTRMRCQSHPYDAIKITQSVELTRKPAVPTLSE